MSKTRELQRELDALAQVRDFAMAALATQCNPSNIDRLQDIIDEYDEKIGVVVNDIANQPL